MARPSSILDPPLARWIEKAISDDENNSIGNALSTSSFESYVSNSASPDMLSATTTSTSSPFVIGERPSGLDKRRILPPSGKISKRQSRPSKRAGTTTYITADPANFREMVERVTGMQFGGGGVEPAAVNRPVQQVCLPTLDTSVFLLDRAVQGNGSVGPGPVDGFDIDTFFSCFPVMESGSVM